MGFLSASDYDDYLISLADFTRYNRDYIEVLRKAVEAGYTLLLREYFGLCQDY